MSKYVNLGQMLTTKEPDERGESRYYIKVAEGVEIKINGKVLEGDTISVSRATDKFYRMLDSGKMTEAEFDLKVAAHSKGGKQFFVKFDVSAKTKE